MAEPSNKIFIISSPSGAGKSTLIAHVREKNPNIYFSISCTTRKPRPGEQNGREYYFLGTEAFKRHIENDAFIEWEQVYNNYYGTLKSEIQKAFDQNKHIIIEVDVKGMDTFVRQFPQAVSVFIDLPSIEEYEKRLRRRQTETEVSLKRRLEEIETERKEKDKFKYIVINDDLETSKKRILEIFKQETGGKDEPS